LKESLANLRHWYTVSTSPLAAPADAADLPTPPVFAML
jgi:hypothetical protein